MSNGRAVRWSTGVYRQLLHAYPRAFRHQFGAEMELDFQESAGEAWQRGRTRALAELWVHVLGDWLVTLPYEYYRAFQGAWAMNDVPENESALSGESQLSPEPLSPARLSWFGRLPRNVQVAGKMALSVFSSFLLYWLFLAVVCISMLTLSLVSPVKVHYGTWPPTELILLLLPPLFTSFIACRIKDFYLPRWTAPAGPIIMTLAMATADSRAPWYGGAAFVLMTAAAAIAGCFISFKLPRRAAPACAV